MILYSYKMESEDADISKIDFKVNEQLAVYVYALYTVFYILIKCLICLLKVCIYLGETMLFPIS